MSDYLGAGRRGVRRIIKEHEETFEEERGGGDVKREKDLHGKKSEQRGMKKDY